MAPLVALPPDKVTGRPKFAPSRLNWTVPVRVPAPGATGVTVAVKVTDWPNTEGLAEALTVVVVLALLTVCVRFGEVLVRKLPSPLYTAVIVWLPTERVAVTPLVALLPDRVTAAPKLTPSILNWTVPLEAPAPGATALT